MVLCSRSGHRKMARSWIGRCWTIRTWKLEASPACSCSMFNACSILSSLVRAVCAWGRRQHCSLPFFPMTASEVCYFILQINFACARNRKSIRAFTVVGEKKLSAPLMVRVNVEEATNLWVETHFECLRHLIHRRRLLSHISIQFDNSMAPFRMRTYHEPRCGKSFECVHQSVCHITHHISIEDWLFLFYFISFRPSFSLPAMIRFIFIGCAMFTIHIHMARRLLYITRRICQHEWKNAGYYFMWHFHAIIALHQRFVWRKTQPHFVELLEASAN